MEFEYFVKDLHVAEEHPAAAIPGYPKVVEDIIRVFTCLYTFIELLPFVTYHFSTGEASYRYYHSGFAYSIIISAR
jgi:hypothetical protein